MIRALLVVVVALLLALGWSLFRAESHKGAAADAAHRADQAEASRDAARQEVTDLRASLATERRAAQDMSNVGSAHEDDRRDAESVPAAVAADLRAGTLRLRAELAGCATDRVSLAAGAAAERDAAAAVREQIAGDLVRVGRDADDHVAACHAVIRADRRRAAEVQP